MKLIEAISDEGGMTKAARKLHLTQPALSHQLKEIEERLETQLFLRVKRRMVLTEAGRQLLVSARRVLPDLTHTEENIRKIANGKQGVLRISTQCNTCYYWLPSLLKGMKAKFPGVEVQIVLEATYHPVEELLAGNIDLAIAHKRIPDKGLSYMPLFVDELLVITAPDHPLASRRFIAPQDFADQDLIVYAIPGEQSFVFREVLNPAQVTPRSTYKIALTEAIVEMVTAGMGISIMARWAVASYLKSGQLAGVRLTRKGVRRHWAAVTLAAASAPPYYLEFARMLSQKARSWLRGLDKRGNTSLLRSNTKLQQRSS